MTSNTRERLMAVMLALPVVTASLSSCSAPAQSTPPAQAATAAPSPTPEASTAQGATSSAAPPSAGSAQSGPSSPSPIESATASAEAAASPVPSAAVASAEAVDVGEVTVTGGTVPNLDAVVSGLRSSFGVCVARGRAMRPDSEGTVKLTIRVGTAGQVLGVAAQQTTKIPASVASCMSTRAATAQFEPPQGTKTQVAVLVPVNVPKP